MTIVETRAITGGVDTHADMHVAAALDAIGGLLGVAEFPATPAGYGRLLGWLGGFGTVFLVGVEGTGSYGAGLARHLAAAGVRVVEVDRSDRQDRRRAGKSDPLDAVSAARAAQSGRARGAPKGPGRLGGGDPGADGRQAHCPLRADPDDQSGPVVGPDRP
jgi:transposase